MSIFTAFPTHLPAPCFGGFFLFANSAKCWQWNAGSASWDMLLADSTAGSFLIKGFAVCAPPHSLYTFGAKITTGVVMLDYTIALLHKLLLAPDPFCSVRSYNHRIIELELNKAIESTPSPPINTGIQVKADLTDGSPMFSWMASVLECLPPLKVIASIVVLF